MNPTQLVVQVYSREDIEKLGTMLIEMAHTRDTHGSGDY